MSTAEKQVIKDKLAEIDRKLKSGNHADKRERYYLMGAREHVLNLINQLGMV